MARTRAAERARETTERELMRAALQVFVRKGYHTATIADIVAEAGVRQGTFYLYFENKPAIFRALLREYRDQILAEVFDVDLRGVRTEADWLELADRLATFLLAHIDTHGDFIRLFITEAPTVGSGFLQEANTFSAAIVGEIARMLRHGIRAGLVRDMDVDAVALIMFGGFKEAVRQSCFRPATEPSQTLIPRVIRSQAQLVLK